MFISHSARMMSHLDLLEKAYQERSGCLTDLKVDRDWDPLRSDPRFIDLLKKIGLDK